MNHSIQNQENFISDNNSDIKEIEILETNKKKQPQQFKALFCKNLALQSKQIGTNICQITTPLLCLLLVYLVQLIISDDGDEDQNYEISVPFFFNVPGLLNAYPYLDTRCHQWYMYDFEEGVDQKTKDFVGYNEGESSSSGFLSNILSKQKCNFYDNFQDTYIEKTVPYFENPPHDQSIDEYLEKSIETLNEQPYQRGNDIKGNHILPDGTVTFSAADEKSLNYTIQINDVRMIEYHRRNGISKLVYRDPKDDQRRGLVRVTEGMLSLMDLINRSYLRSVNEDVWLVSGVQYMPLVGESSGAVIKLISMTGAYLYPLALSLLLPIFIYTMVLEKEEKLLDMMKMNGLKMKNYWTVNIIFFLLITFITFLIFFIFGCFIFQQQIFTQTNKFFLFLTLAAWGVTQISMAIFFQSIISKARKATIFGYLLSIWTCIIAVTFNTAVYPYPYTLPWGMRFYPTFAFSRIIYDISIACSLDACYNTLSSVDNEMWECLILMFLMGFLFLFFGLKMESFGKYIEGKKIAYRQKKINGKKYNQLENEQQKLGINNESNNSSDKSQAQQNIQIKEEDQDVEDLRQFINQMEPNNYKNYPLITKELRKQYQSAGGRKSHVAVKSLNLIIEPGEILGLLGPNGSGKSTTISMLNGMHPPTQGNAWIAGYDIISQLDQVQLNIGVCPQFNLLWSDLTVKEHLIFYARLKGIESNQLNKQVNDAIKSVKLEVHSNKKIKELSGGMQRRLSVAISLVGDPKVIFLDEPSTGLDPENRRQLWDILSECKGKRAMVLTTHSMEEADVLCNKIAIIANGELKCIGPQIKLKKKYGGGSHLYINVHKEKFLEQKIRQQILNGEKLDSEILEIQKQKDGLNQQNEENEKENQFVDFYAKKIIEFIKQILPNANQTQCFNGNVVFQVPQEGLKMSVLFQQIELEIERLNIANWGISESSLEDVFMKIVEESESQQEKDYEEYIQEEVQENQMEESDSE